MLRIRPALAHEISDLSAIENQADEIYAVYPEFADLQDQTSVVPADAEHLPRNAIVFVAEADMKLVGFAFGHPIDDYFYLAQLSVIPKAQNKGIGTQLLEAIVTAARQQDLKGVTLFTYTNLPFNAPYYAARGFQTLEVCDVGPLLAQKYLADTAEWGRYGQRAIMGVSFVD